jgi:hypothetical protein
MRDGITSMEFVKTHSIPKLYLGKTILFELYIYNIFQLIIISHKYPTLRNEAHFQMVSILKKKIIHVKHSYIVEIKKILDMRVHLH